MHVRDLNNLSLLSESLRGRLAIISHTHPSISKGGAEIAAYTLFLSLQELGLDPIFVSACHGTDRSKLVLASQREYAIFYQQSNYDHFYHLASPVCTDDLITILRSNNISVVNFHHFMNFGIQTINAVASVYEWKTFFTLHEFLLICYNHGQMITNPSHQLCERSTPVACTKCFPDYSRQQFSMRRNLFLASLEKVAGFISPSHFLARRYAEWGLPSEAINVVENGLLAHRASPRPGERLAHKVWTFGFFGQINPFKGVDTILKATEIIDRNKKLRNSLRIVIHGNIIGQSTAFVDRLLELVERFPFLHFNGPYQNESVSTLMSDCDYVIVPSKWWENSPVVIQEAFAAGCPVICTGIGGMAEKVVNKVSGLHFRNNDAADLVRALEEGCQLETYRALVGGIPAVIDGGEMAVQYLEIFNRINLQLQESDEISSPLA